MTEHNTLTDLQLVALLKDDDEAAFALVYQRYAENLTAFAGSKLYDLDDARDIIHDIFVKLWEERKGLNINKNLKAYLFTAVRYRIVDKIRKNITREDYLEMVLSLHTTPGSDTEQQLAAKELEQQVRTALEKLSPRLKEIYRLSREEHLSIPEIAARLNLSEQTVKNQLSLALKHLRTSLNYLSAAALVLWCLR